MPTRNDAPKATDRYESGLCKKEKSTYPMDTNDKRRPRVWFRDLGLIPYREAWELQTALHRELLQRKLANRGRPPEEVVPQVHHLLFCTHPHVYTLGKSGSMAHLLLSQDELRARGIEFFEINRGGDITYHGPGQVVGYPIFDLDEFFTDVHRYVRTLEEVIIRTLAEYGLKGMRIPKYTGVWLEATEVWPQRKICAIGVHLSRWVSMHGFAFNVNTDLTYFGHIVPCGIRDENKAVTSLALELGREVDEAEVKTALKRHFAELFAFEWVRQEEAAPPAK